MDVKIIGRSSGRSSVGAAAYRAGEKLHSIAHASYQSGEKIQGKGGKITHDYTKKQGVVYKEIILPDNAPEEYKDRETLWNAVEASEKRKDAQLAREIIVALPREFDLAEQIEVMRQYVKENFVSKGMIADFAIHNTGEGNLNSPAEGVASGVRNQQPELAPHHTANPHAHIMLTTRNVSRDGFGLKNTDWNKKEFLLSYRKAWANIINSTLARKGLDERIDHRTLKAQGLDREATIHLGHQAAALEKKGIRTERGDYNREIRQRNLDLPAKGAASGVRNQKSEFAPPHAANETRTALNSALGRLLMEHFKERGNATPETQQRDKDRAIPKEAESMEQQEVMMQGMRDLQETTMQGIKELQRQQQEATLQIIRALQQQPQAAKPLEYIEPAEGSVNAEVVPNEVITKRATANRVNETQENPDTPNKTSYAKNRDYIENPSVIKQGRRSAKFREVHSTLDKRLRAAQSEYDEDGRESRRLDGRAETIDEHTQNIQTLTGQLAQIQAEHQNLRPFLGWKRKRELDKEIERVEGELRAALFYFEKNYHITPEEASAEIARTLQQKQFLDDDMKQKYKQMMTLEIKMDSIKYGRSEHEYKIKRKVDRQAEQDAADRPEQTQTHGIERRRSVTKVMKELRREADEATKRRRRRKALAKSKPKPMYEVKPLPQKRLHRDDYYVKRTKYQSIGHNR
jgi:hypothetical protein